jgi:hypothetical protein
LKVHISSFSKVPRLPSAWSPSRTASSEGRSISPSGARDTQHHPTRLRSVQTLCILYEASVGTATASRSSTNGRKTRCDPQTHRKETNDNAMCLVHRSILRILVEARRGREPSRAAKSSRLYGGPWRVNNAAQGLQRVRIPSYPAHIQRTATSAPDLPPLNGGTANCAPQAYGWLRLRMHTEIDTTRHVISYNAQVMRGGDGAAGGRRCGALVPCETEALLLLIHVGDEK